VHLADTDSRCMSQHTAPFWTPQQQAPAMVGKVVKPPAAAYRRRCCRPAGRTALGGCRHAGLWAAAAAAAAPPGWCSGPCSAACSAAAAAGSRHSSRRHSRCVAAMWAYARQLCCSAGRQHKMLGACRVQPCLRTVTTAVGCSGGGAKHNLQSIAVKP
jgi:hypothetical protein